MRPLPPLKSTTTHATRSGRITVVVPVAFMLITLLHLSSPLFADHPDKSSSQCGEALLEAKAFRRNLWFYKAVGARVVVKGAGETRRWWCLWLCKRRVDKSAEQIWIDSTYFFRYRSIVTTTNKSTNCSGTDSCTLREFAAGIAISFPELKPDTLEGDLLPIAGVLSGVTVTVDGETCLMAPVAAGLHHREDAFSNLKSQVFGKTFLGSASSEYSDSVDSKGDLTSETGAGIGLERRP